MGSQPEKKRKPLPEIAPNKLGDTVYKILGHSAKALYDLLATVKVEGGEKLPLDKGYIIVANHLTVLDPITVAYPSFKRGTLPRFLAKESLFRAPVLGWIMQNLAHIPVMRGSVDARKSLDTAQNIIEAGGAVIIYPEGTLTSDPAQWPMSGRTGVARLALATGAPVYPIAHWGDQEIVPQGAKGVSLFPRKTVKIKVGDPIDLQQFVSSEPGKKYSRSELQAVTDAMLDEVTGLLEELRGETRPATRWNHLTQAYEKAED